MSDELPMPVAGMTYHQLQPYWDLAIAAIPLFKELGFTDELLNLLTLDHGFELIFERARTNPLPFELPTEAQLRDRILAEDTDDVRGWAQ